MSNHDSSHVEWEPAQKTFGLKTFLVEVGQDDKNQLLVRWPNTITSLLASKMSRNMKMFAETNVKDNHYLCKVESLPTLISATILEIKNYSWCNRSLDEDPVSLKSVLTVLNLCGPHTNQLCYRQCVNMHTRLATSCKEEKIGQFFEYSKPNTIDSFIKGRKTTL